MLQCIVCKLQYDKDFEPLTRTQILDLSKLMDCVVLNTVLFPEQFEVNKDNHFASLSALYHSATVAAFKISVNPSVPLTATSRNVRKITH